MSGKYRHYVFTYNNWTEAGIAILHTYLRTNSTYYMYAFEMGESGTPHLQGYVSWRNPRTLRGVIDGDVLNMHWEVCKKSFGAQDTYIRLGLKDGVPKLHDPRKADWYVQWGVRPASAARRAAATMDVVPDIQAEAVRIAGTMTERQRIREIFERFVYPHADDLPWDPYPSNYYEDPRADE